MSWFLALPDIPADAITLLVLLLISLASWVKTKFFTKAEDEAPLERDDDPMREVIWRRLVGEEEEPRQDERPSDESPPPLPARPVRRPPAVRVALQPAAPAVTISKREAELAEAFEHSTAVRRRPRTGHRREVDRMLRSPSAAKNAILLTEILGPPVALRPIGEDK